MSYYLFLSVVFTSVVGLGIVLVVVVVSIHFLTYIITRALSFFLFSSLSLDHPHITLYDLLSLFQHPKILLSYPIELRLIETTKAELQEQNGSFNTTI